MLHTARVESSSFHRVGICIPLWKHTWLHARLETSGKSSKLYNGTKEQERREPWKGKKLLMADEGVSSGE